jgi:hypothetical protein
MSAPRDLEDPSWSLAVETAPTKQMTKFLEKHQLFPREIQVLVVEPAALTT